MLNKDGLGKQVREHSDFHSDVITDAPPGAIYSDGEASDEPLPLGDIKDDDLFRYQKAGGLLERNLLETDVRLRLNAQAIRDEIVSDLPAFGLAFIFACSATPFMGLLPMASLLPGAVAVFSTVWAAKIIFSFFSQRHDLNEDMKTSLRLWRRYQDNEKAHKTGEISDKEYFDESGKIYFELEEQGLLFAGINDDLIEGEEFDEKRFEFLAKKHGVMPGQPTEEENQKYGKIDKKRHGGEIISETFLSWDRFLKSFPRIFQGLLLFFAIPQKYNLKDYKVKAGHRAAVIDDELDKDDPDHENIEHVSVDREFVERYKTTRAEVRRHIHIIKKDREIVGDTLIVAGLATMMLAVSTGGLIMNVFDFSVLGEALFGAGNFAGAVNLEAASPMNMVNLALSFFALKLGLSPIRKAVQELDHNYKGLEGTRKALIDMNQNPENYNGNGDKPEAQP